MTRIASPGRKASTPAPRLAPPDLAERDYVLPVACVLALAASIALAAVVYSLHHANKSIATRGTAAITNVSLVRETPVQGTGASATNASTAATATIPAPVSPASPVDQEPVQVPNPALIAALQPHAAEAMAEPPRAGAVRTGASAIAFQRSLESHIARFRRYPSLANNERLHGLVQISFDMDRSGSVTEVRIASSSGHLALDAEAVNIVRRAAPLPAIPTELPGRLCILLPIDFTAASRSSF